ncbi:MAG: methyltransferase domain-containing protein [Anaerolineaceae bacterium]
MTLSVAPPPERWAFWAPTPDESIEGALVLAGVGRGTRFLDLGCGDGRVLVAAALRGAEVRGVEIDPELAAIARKALAESDLAGTVEVDDIFATSVDADVIYAYLTPVVLSRLRGRLENARPGTRVVTPRYGIAGWQPVVLEGGNHLYSLPSRRKVEPVASGWPARAVLVLLPEGRRVLVPLTFITRPGLLNLQLDPHLARAANYAIADSAIDAPGPVPLDLIFEAHGAGSVIAGSIRAQGAELTLAAVFSKSARGQWDFGAEEGPEFRTTLDEAIELARSGG